MEIQYVCVLRWWTVQHGEGIFCREGTKEEEHGLGLDKTEENPSAYCIVTL